MSGQPANSKIDPAAIMLQQQLAAGNIPAQMPGGGYTGNFSCFLRCEAPYGDLVYSSVFYSTRNFTEQKYKWQRIYIESLM